MKFSSSERNGTLRTVTTVATFCTSLIAVTIFITLFSVPVCAQQSAPAPVVVQPDAPGKPTRTLPTTTNATLPPSSAADVKFMQGMIMHHGQAVEMTALIES